ncbi:autoinducer binding domain-containing protein [Pseudomonas sp. BBP2017]|uniref:autoinducer binding domain-containing protein n=1 Tax=Pseudomonas sp. BBP2017 TaxID=2109731 RepID=UPI000D1166E6|nr:autoinducer binding domain-containing protein [Pseudomonas sp. BBP2017]PSS58230.1 LuxR family transcriptional regulator [Pseudomonas sp. BBP2017]
MHHWKEKQLQQLLSATNEQQMSDVAASLAQQLGMEYFSFTAHTALDSQPRTYNNFPAAWNEHYQRCNYVDIDPIVAHCHTSLLPILWDDDAFRQTPEYWEQARLHGLRYGWSQSAHDPHQNESILSVVRSSTPVDTNEFYNTAGQTIWLCNLMHTLVLNRQSTRPTPSFHLSARETEVLKWSAAGKTAAECARILTLSQSTINFHIRSIITKLNTSNKAGAIAIAAVNGLLR